MIQYSMDSCLQILKEQLAKDGFCSGKVLVTGGAGFIGSWLCDAFICANSTVHCIDNLSTGMIDNIEHLLDVKSFTLKKIDVTRIDLDGKYNHVLHFASRASPEEYQHHPIQTLLANSVGTWNMLELARKNDAMLLYASSSEVYGDARVVPTPESCWGMVNPIGVRSCYDEGKRFGEALCMAYKRTYGLDVRIARIFNTFGPRIREDGAYGRVVSRFIMQALKGHEITVYGDGGQTRSFCYISDTLSGILKMITSEEAKGEVFNIGNPREISILNLGRKIKDLTGSHSNITYTPLPQDDPVRRCPDISKARQLLNWEPKIDLEEALKTTVEWFKLKLS